MKTVIAVILLLTGVGAPAQADYLGAQCEGDSVRFTIGAFGYFEDPAGQSLFIEARVVGSCDEGARINPESFPYPPYLRQVTYGVTLPAYSTERYVFYRLYREDGEGNVFPAETSGDLLPYTYEACTTDAVFARGWLVRSASEVIIEVCTDHCWEWWPLDFVDATPGWESFVDTGSLVNVYGEVFVDGMPGASRLVVSRVVLETDAAGCDAVSSGFSNWGSLKATYR